ncbi:MAG TPA: hypothetical protein VIR33_00005, partial [Thermopolyspora sp.]
MHDAGSAARTTLGSHTSLVPVKILHISDCYLPRLGGIEVQVADLVRTQRGAGHSVEVATATRGERLDGVHRIVARLPFD